MIVVRPIIGPPPRPLDLGEKRSQAVVGILGPDVEGVVVTLGAAEPKTQKSLRRQLGLDVGLEGVHRVIDRPALLEVGRVAHRRQERPNHLVPGAVLAQARVDPGLVPIGAVALPGRS